MKQTLFSFIFMFLPLVVNAQEDDSGSCGPNLKYEYVYATHTLTISGTGEMDNYGSGSTEPWQSYASNINHVIIKTGVTSIGDCAFNSCGRLKSVTIPTSVTSIGFWAFGYCWDLTSVTIPNGVTSIGERAFTQCTGLKYLSLPEGLISIGNSAFSLCTSLTSLDIPNSVKTIEKNAFNGCKSLTSVSFGNGITHIGERVFQECGFTSLSFPDNITSIGECAFQGCRALVSVNLNNVTEMGTQAFAHCESLTSVEFPNSMTAIGNWIFYWCTNLASVTIPNSITSIGIGTFYKCISLTSITIPSSVTYIDEVMTFSGCTGLTSLNVEEGNTVYDSRNNCNAIIKTDDNKLLYGCKNTVIPNSVTSLGDFAIYDCSPLTSIEIPNAVTSIGFSTFDGTTWYDNQPNGVVYIDKFVYKYKGDMPEHSHIAIKEGIKVINSYAFKDYSNLISVTLPNSVTFIGDGAFMGTNLTDFYCYAEIIPKTSTYVFQYTSIENVTLHVPIGTVEVYKATEPWKNFKEIVGIGDANGDGVVDVADVVEIVNFILEKPSDKFVEAAADANEDKVIDAADVVAVVNIILKGGNVNPARVRAILEANGFIF